MRYMVIERFPLSRREEVYRRLEERGRGLPEGLVYIDSWVTVDVDRCFQLMECQDPALLAVWTQQWGDLVEFEAVPVVSSGEAAAVARAAGQPPAGH